MEKSNDDIESLYSIPEKDQKKEEMPKNDIEKNSNQTFDAQKKMMKKQYQAFQNLS